MAGAFQWRIDNHCSWGQLSTAASNATKVAPIGSSKLQSTIVSYGQWSQRRQIQLIDWPLPSMLTGQSPLNATCTGLRATKFNHECCQEVQSRDLWNTRPPHCLWATMSIWVCFMVMSLLFDVFTFYFCHLTKELATSSKTLKVVRTFIN